MATAEALAAIAKPWTIFKQAGRNMPLMIGIECRFCGTRPKIKNAGSEVMAARASLAGWLHRKVGAGFFSFPRTEYACPGCVTKRRATI